MVMVMDDVDAAGQLPKRNGPQERRNSSQPGKAGSAVTSSRSNTPKSASAAEELAGSGFAEEPVLATGRAQRGLIGKSLGRNERKRGLSRKLLALASAQAMAQGEQRRAEWCVRFGVCACTTTDRRATAGDSLCTPLKLET
jgi:hypothetical protein